MVDVPSPYLVDPPKLDMVPEHVLEESRLSCIELDKTANI